MSLCVVSPDFFVYCRSRYLYIVLGVYLRMLGAPSVQHCSPYRYLLPNVYLSVADISNPDWFACGCRTWISLFVSTSPVFRSSASHPEGPHDRLVKKTVNRVPIDGDGRGQYNL